MTFAWRVSLVTLVICHHLPDFYCAVSAWRGLLPSLYLHRGTGLYFPDPGVMTLINLSDKPVERLGESEKKDKLQVSFGVLKDTVHYYQAAVKASIYADGQSEVQGSL